ncbi:pilus assembly protein CpaE [Pigmentiphaga soli]|uniref:Pilus assembly protein CpaE n=1 Tax=Pigmentiphaga soli TaxID=1007095 RepID=A0ABP8H5Y1_9BURK
MYDTRRFLFFTADDGSAQRLAAVLQDDGLTVQEQGMPERLSARLLELSPSIVFLDFGIVDADPGKLAQAAELARQLARAAAGVPVVAVGSLTRPEAAVAALRAGVRDFIDLANEIEVREVVHRVLHAQAGPSAGPRRGQLVVLLGVRAGVGATTLAAHLSTLAQLQQNAACAMPPGAPPAAPAPPAEPARGRAESQTMLLDLGWPVADGQLYLNVAGNFHFAEAVQNVRRLDDTLVNTAMARSASGVAVVSLPRDLGEMRTVSHGDSLALLDKLREHFGVLVADLGGFSNPDFVAGMVRAADHAWLVTDQSVGSIVSLAERLRDFEERGIDRALLRLIVNRYDERYGMTAEQIASRFKVMLQATLPDRTPALMASTNQGKLLHEVSDRDPYVRGVQGLVCSLMTVRHAKAGANNWLARWLPGVHKYLV